MPNIKCSHKSLNIDNSSKKNDIQKTLINFNFTSDEFLMIPFTFLYNENIGRPKLTEQKTHFSI